MTVLMSKMDKMTQMSVHYFWLIKWKVIYRQAFLRIGVVTCFNIMPLTLNSYFNLLHFVLKNLLHFVSCYCYTLHQILLRFMLISEVALLFGNICTIGPLYLKALSRTPSYLEQKVISLGFGCFFFRHLLSWLLNNL